jgi:hypothetical protein
MDSPHRDPTDEPSSQQDGSQAWSLGPEGSPPVPGVPHVPDAEHPNREQAGGNLPGFTGFGPEGNADTVRNLDVNPSPGNLERGDGYMHPPLGGSVMPPGEIYTQGVPPPAGRKSAFNWIACCGIGCGVVLVIGIVAGIVIWRSMGGLVKDTMSVVKVTTEVEAADISQVVSTATPVTAEQLSLAPETYRDQWLAFEGMVTTDPDASHEIPQSGSMEGTAYFVEPNIIVMDLSNAVAVATGGDLIQCVGKLAIMDFSKLGSVGAEIEKDMKETGELGGQAKMIFLVTKGIEVVSDGESLTDLPAETDDTDALSSEDAAADAAEPPAGDGWSEGDGTQ